MQVLQKRHRSLYRFGTRKHVPGGEGTNLINTAEVAILISIYAKFEILPAHALFPGIRINRKTNSIDLHPSEADNLAL